MPAELSRREAILLLTGSVVAAAASPHLASAQLTATRGCILSSSQLENHASEISGVGAISDRLITSTGNQQMDRSLGRALIKISELFGEQPGFGFINDGGSPNAYASHKSQVNGTWGTVLFGKTLFHDLLNRYDDEGIAVLAVVAHEFGHIAQYRSGIDDMLLRGQRTVKRVELHADFLSGYFLGHKKRTAPGTSIWAAGHTLFSIGDYQFNNENHHGTPDERVQSAEAGYKLGYDGEAGFGTVFSQGAEYVLSVF